MLLWLVLLPRVFMIFLQESIIGSKKGIVSGSTSQDNTDGILEKSDEWKNESCPKQFLSIIGVKILI